MSKLPSDNFLMIFFNILDFMERLNLLGGLKMIQTPRLHSVLFKLHK